MEKRPSYTIAKTLVPGPSQKSFAIDAGNGESSVKCAKEAALSARDDIMPGGSNTEPSRFYTLECKDQPTLQLSFAAPV